jgi:hypothetical protein
MVSCRLRLLHLCGNTSISEGIVNYQCTLQDDQSKSLCHGTSPRPKPASIKPVLRPEKQPEPEAAQLTL